MSSIINEKEEREIEQKLILSYIKFYFKKISNYFKNYEEDNELRQIILDQNNLGFILTEIQYFDPNLLPEIIEDFTDDKQIFQKCIISLILNLYGKLTQKSMSKEFQKSDKRYLFNLEREIHNALSLFKKLNPIPLEVEYMKRYLNGIKLKIEAKKFILNINFFSRFFPKNKSKLNNLIEIYSNSVDYDVNILNELKRLKNLFYSNRTNITKEEKFLKEFQNHKKDYDYLFTIFNEYPIMENENISVYIDQDYTNFIELNDQQKVNFLNESKIKYELTLTIIKEKQGNMILGEVYEKIIILINIIKDQIKI